MANPQKENGFTPIANEILEHLSFPGINGSEYRIMFVVIRKTYGFQKKNDMISLTQFQKYTGMKRNKVVESVYSLVTKRVLLKDKNIYRFNKDWENWIVTKRVLSTQTGTGGSTQKGVKGSTQKGTHNIKKERRTKERATTSVASEEIVKLIKLFEEVNPSIEKYYGNTAQRAAAARMIQKHGLAKLEIIIKALPQINAKPYWPKSTTPCQLEDNFGKYKALSDTEKAKVAKNKSKVAFV